MPRPRENFRWVICALLFTAALVNYMDRQVLGLLKPILSERFHWSEEAYANIVVAFQAAYAIGQTLIGPFIEMVGTKLAYTCAVVVWSLAAMSHTLARSVLGFGGARFALGLGESGNFPISIRTVTEWFPQRERSVATGIFNFRFQHRRNRGALGSTVTVYALRLEGGLHRTGDSRSGVAGFLAGVVQSTGKVKARR